MELTILYADDDYVAIHKPSGLLVHRTALDKAATEFAVQLLRDQLGQIVYPCHRLDRPTSGVLLFALSAEAARFAQTEFASRNVCKEYQAVVRGWTDEQGSIDYSLRSEEVPDKSFDAQTDYKRLSQSVVEKPIGKYEHARFALLELKPLTGRKHQLRRHLAHIRHPIIGDTRHGDGAQNRFIREHFNCNRLLLHACSLEIRLPSNKQKICIQSVYDEGFSSIAQALNLLP